MVPGLHLIEDAVSREYVECIVDLLPREIMQGIDRQTSDQKLGMVQNPDSSRQEALTERETSVELPASLQVHYFRPLPEFVSMISEDVIPPEWKSEVWQGSECNCSIVQRYRAGEGIQIHV